LEISFNTLSEVQQEVEIQLTGEELQPHFEEAYEKFRPKVELKGFRKGKVPLAMIKKIYGETIEHDALDSLAGEFYRKVMRERNIQPIGQPSLVDMDFKRGGHLRFKIQYEVRPAIELKKYKRIAIEKPIHDVTEEEIKTEIDHLRRMNSTTTEVNAVTDVHHIVTGDVQELDETGSPLIGKKTRDAKFLLSDETLAKELRDALRSAEVGREYRITFTAQQDDHEHTFHIIVNVTKIEKVNLPEFNDDFVRKLTKGKAKTADEFTGNLRVDLKRFWDEQSEKRVAEEIVSEIVRQHEFTVPESLINGLLDSYVDDIRNKSRDKRLPGDFDEEKFRSDNRTLAIFQGKWMLLKGRIAEEENITITGEEIVAAAESEAARIGISKERLVEYYKNSSVAAERLLSDKLMAFLKRNAVITERPARPD